MFLRIWGTTSTAVLREVMLGVLDLRHLSPLPETQARLMVRGVLWMTQKHYGTATPLPIRRLDNAGRSGPLARLRIMKRPDYSNCIQHGNAFAVMTLSAMHSDSCQFDYDSALNYVRVYTHIRLWHIHLDVVWLLRR